MEGRGGTTNDRKRGNEDGGRSGSEEDSPLHISHLNCAPDLPPDLNWI